MVSQENSNENNHMNGITVGNPVTGNDFFDRENEIRQVAESLKNGDHLLITAPRRTGKTSLLKEVARRKQNQFYFLFVDLQACTQESETIVKIAEEAKPHRDLWQKVGDVFRNVMGDVLARIDEVGAAEINIKLRDGVAADWKGKGNELLARLAEAPRPVVILLDELPVLITEILTDSERNITPEGRSRARVFLSWFREASIRHKGKINFVACGSIGLAPVVNRAGISETLSTFTPFELPAWDRNVALAYLGDRAKLNNIQFAPGADERILEKLKYYIPQHVQMMMRYIYVELKGSASRVCTAAVVERVFAEKMLRLHAHVDLATYEERLSRVVGHGLRPLAIELLTEAAIAGRLSHQSARFLSQESLGSATMDDLRFLLSVFEHDGYLEQVDDGYVFKSHLLREWWKKRYGNLYLPVAARTGENK